MSHQVATTDPVVAIRARIDAIHDAMEAAPTRRDEAKIGNALPALWTEMARTPPTTLDGAMIVLEEADHYEGELLQGWMVVNFPGLFRESAARVRRSDLSACKLEQLDFVGQASALALGADHPLPRLVSNAVAFLRTRH